MSFVTEVIISNIYDGIRSSSPLPFQYNKTQVCVGPAGTMFTVLENHIVSSFSSNVRESGVFNVRDSGVSSQLRDSGVSCHSLLQAHTLLFSADGQ